MKNKIIYTVTFLITFGAVTFAIIELNNMYENIFEFNFKQVKSAPENIQFAELGTSGEVLMLKRYLEHEFRSRIVDSVKANTPVKIDTVYQEVVQDEKLLDSLQELKRELELTQDLLAKQKEESHDSITTNSVAVDKDWIRKTSKLLEEMEPKKAAKVLSNYSDNEARELIYAMKQKKAAEILSILDPIFVNKITSSQI